MCHEIGHAMTEWHGGDMEYYGEMGAMNEAYSDILGEYLKRIYTMHVGKVMKEVLDKEYIHTLQRS